MNRSVGAPLEPLRVSDIRSQYIDALPGFVPIAPVAETAVPPSEAGDKKTPFLKQ